MNWAVVSVWLFVGLALAKPANDWSKPCFDGECAYDMHPSTGNSGVLRMSGAGITDITPAAGWIILDCDPHALEQEIRLVCSSTNHEEAGCHHVFENGAEHKVVRLPESCTEAPFLRIASATIADDQHIPTHAKQRITKRDGNNPVVHTIRVDSNWAAADVSKVGVVHFDFIGSNTPDAAMMATRYSSAQSPLLVKQSAKLSKRGQDGFFDWIKNAFNAVKDAVVHAVKTVVNAVVHVVQSTVQKLKELTSFSINPEWIKKINIDTGGQMIPVYHLQAGSVHCNKGIAATLDVSAGGKVDADVRFGLMANGSVIPPQIGSWAVYAIVNGDVDVHLSVVASVYGQLTSGRKQVAQVDVTPLQIPGIISLGPFVRLEVEAMLDVGLDVFVDAHLKYKVNKLEFWHPKKLTEEDPAAKSGYESLDFQQSPLTIEATADVIAQANITAHLIPSLHLGLSLFGGAASASGFIEVDAWARLSLEAHASASASTHKRELGSELGDRELSYVPPYLGARGLQATDTATLTFKGCLGVFAGASVRAGAEAKLGPIKGETPPWVIFTTPELSIFHMCWPHGPSRREISLLPTTPLEKRSGTMTCGRGKRTQLSATKTDPHTLKRP
ncbi:hypothetical protein ONZ45_g2441 [Pleurotus djamor]|nr:hypothetical protein ONZ45_g2441 [Pleurotus djamor]